MGLKAVVDCAKCAKTEELEGSPDAKRLNHLLKGKWKQLRVDGAKAVLCASCYAEWRQARSAAIVAAWEVFAG